MENNEIQPQSQQPQKPKVQYRFGIVAVILLGLLAVIFDLLSLIPVVGDFLGPIFWVIAGIYMWKKKIGFFDGKKIATWGISLALKMIPVLQEIPVELTLGIIVVFFITRTEDKTGISHKVVTAKPGTTPPRIKPPLINGQEGIRLPNQRTSMIK